VKSILKVILFSKTLIYLDFLHRVKNVSTIHFGLEVIIKQIAAFISIYDKTELIAYKHVNYYISDDLSVCYIIF
jgi:hypothetical protein